jgi:two-component system, chemotaxis family, sensor kinase CheA
MNAFIQDPALLREFLIESEELLQGMDQDLVVLESSPNDEELLNRIFRALHTIKGTAGFLGLDPVVKLGHDAEDVLTSLRKGQISFTHKIMDALLAARDQLGKMLAEIRAGGLKQYDLDPLLTELQQAQNAATVKVEAATLEPSANTAEAHSAPAPQHAESKLQAEPSGAPNSKSRNALTAQSMRVDVRKLDELVNLIGELVLERNRLLQLAKEVSSGRTEAHGADSPLNHAVARLSFTTEELQAAGLRTRMVPIEAVFAKFPRLVCDLARSLQKDAELEISGQDTEIDKNMVELIGDPLVHLVRNSLDHGIELPDVRERANKPRRGKICLEARQQGDHILIAISDDGAGMDPARILRKAIEKGMVTAQRGASLSKREILELIFLPGFSTLDTATNLSGRGVGMDVVRSNLKN